MYNKDFKFNVRFLRPFFATYMLLSFTFSISFGQTQTLCQEIAVPPSATDIDLLHNTNTLPNAITPGINPSNQIKGATDRVVFVGNMVTVTNNIVTFTNCKIRMAEGAGFTVPAGKVLRFINCKIAAADCGKLWNKIDALSGSFVYMTKGNQVEDANVVISAQGATVVCTDNILNRNYIGIGINTSGNYYINGNTFDKTSDLINENTNTNRIIFGVVHYGSTLLSLKNNIFKSLTCGVLSFASNLNVEGGSFININKNLYAGTAKYAGTGIYANVKSNVRVGYNTVFNNCLTAAIKADLSVLECRDATFRNIKTDAIFCDGSIGANKIANNNFSGHSNNTKSYITILGENTDLIQNNIFDLEKGVKTKSFFAIQVGSTGVPKGSQITGNIFNGTFPHVESFCEAILVTTGTYIIHDNHILADKPTGAGVNQVNIGIDLFNNCHNSEIVGNEINSNIEKGIEILNSQKTTLCTNTITKAAIGLSFVGPSGSAKVIDTDFSDNSDVALSLVGNGINLGRQIHGGNKFPQNVRHTGNDVDFSKFIVNNDLSTACGQVDFMPQNVLSANGWFDTKDGCFQGCTQIIANDHSDTELSEYDLRVMDNSIAQYSFSTAETWYAQYNLFEKLMANPSLNTSDASNDFVAIKGVGNIGAFYNVEKEIQKGLSYSGNSQLQSLLATRNSLFQQSLNSYNTWVVDTENVAATLALENAQNLLETAQLALENYIAEYNTYKANILTNANALNQSIATESTMEANLKTVNALKIKYLLEGNLSDLEWNTATQIAEICPMNGAYATAVANNLLAWDRRFVEMTNSCNGGSAAKVQAPKNSKALVFPNPVINELNVQYQGKGNSLIAEIYDISGKLILTQVLANQNQNTLNVAEFKNGFYIINLIEDDKMVATERFVKIN
jgi:Secretion system C-terminal sorting domain